MDITKTANYIRILESSGVYACDSLRDRLNDHAHMLTPSEIAQEGLDSALKNESLNRMFEGLLPFPETEGFDEAELELSQLICADIVKSLIEMAEDLKDKLEKFIRQG